MRPLRASLVPLLYLRHTNSFLVTRKRIINPILEQFDHTNHLTKCSRFNFLDHFSNNNYNVATFCTSSGGNYDPREDGLVDTTNEECDEVGGEYEVELVVTDPEILRDVEKIVGIFCNSETSICQAKSNLEEARDVKMKKEVVSEVLARLKNNFEAAYTFFLWAGKQPGYEHSTRELNSMIAILAKMRKFGTAWAIIDEMRGIETGRSLVSHQTLLIMIRRYSAVHDVAKAISTFYAHKKFKLEAGLAQFQDFLSALCRYKNVRDAEHMMLANKDVYPMDTKSCNIVLRGWCELVGSTRDGKRIWMMMKERNIKRDIYSYASIISGYSKGQNIDVVFNLFHEMKAMGVEPDRKVYDAVIHAFAIGKLVKEARNLLETMEMKGVSPNNETYGSLIMPLCNKNHLDTAKEFFNQMIERGLCPTARTCYYLFRSLNTEEEVFEFLQRIYSTGCHPNQETYVTLIKKFSSWRQIENVYKIWNEMSTNGLDPNRSSYIALIQALFLNSKLAEAHKYYLEMIKKHLQPHPRVEEMIQAYLAAKKQEESHVIKLNNHPAESTQHGNVNKEIQCLEEPETRRIKREDLWVNFADL